MLNHNVKYWNRWKISTELNSCCNHQNKYTYEYRNNKTATHQSSTDPIPIESSTDESDVILLNDNDAAIITNHTVNKHK